MQWNYRQVELKKRYPLRISRGVSTGSVNLFVTVETEDSHGVGEAAPGAGADSADACEQQLRSFFQAQGSAMLNPFDAWYDARQSGVAPCAWAAIDIALWDLLARQSGQPLYRLLGLPNRSAPTSVTIGIVPPEVARERIPEILRRTGARYLKVKLGNPDGLDADQSMFSSVMESARKFGVGLRVDANGGWTLSGAKTMMSWLKERGCEYVEQPLNSEVDDELPVLFSDRVLPIFIDESCCFSSDVGRLAHCVDGVNLKLMKCGGITEALRIVATARAHGLKTMIGCMGESSVAIAAGVSLGALFDHIDLDSHLNLMPDPALGLELGDGVVRIPEVPGHGARLTC